MKKWLKTFRKCRFENIWSLSFQLFKHKWFEFQMGKFGKECSTVLDLSLKATTKQSHAGVELTFLILRFHIELRIYDIRHWDYLTGKWED